MMNDIYQVRLSERAIDDLQKVPLIIYLKLEAWIDAVAEKGLFNIRKIPGYHDEPLKGKRKGQRSIRLNRAYRAMYIIDEENNIRVVEILEVNKHDY